MQITPKKRLGQNFLTDQNIQRKIIACCGLKDSDTVIEVGAGRGELTRLIAPGVAKLVAFELDPRLSEALKYELKQYPGVKIIHQDVLKARLSLYLGKGRAKVIGNIPYYITTPIIEHLLNYRNNISEIYLSVQKEFAQRAQARPGSKEYGSLSLFLQYFTRPKVLFIIKNTCFYPRPKPDSAFIKMEVKRKLLPRAKNKDWLFKIIRSSFNQRRKTLRNSLKGVVEASFLDEFLASSGIERNIRPECLCLESFVSLANQFPPKSNLKKRLTK